MDNVENLKITVPENSTRINLVLELDKLIPVERETVETPIFCDNETAIKFNDEMSCILPKIRDFCVSPHPLVCLCLSHYDVGFAEKYIDQLVDGGFLRGFCYPYFENGNPRVAYEPLLLTACILNFTAVSADTRFLRDREINAHIRKVLTLPPQNITEAVTLLYLNEKAHDILGDRLFTVQNVTALKSVLSGSRFFSDWFCADTAKKIFDLSQKAKLPPCFSYLYVLEKIYGVKIQNNCVGFYPASGKLASITVNLNGKKIFVNYVQGYPKKAYIGNIGYSGDIKIDSLPDDYIQVTVQA